jgi:hypothetical protein
VGGALRQGGAAIMDNSSSSLLNKNNTTRVGYCGGVASRQSTATRQRQLLDRAPSLSDIRREEPSLTGDSRWLQQQ